MSALIVQTAVQFYRDGESNIGRANCNLMRAFIAIAKVHMVEEQLEWLDSALKFYDEAGEQLGTSTLP